MSYYKTRVYIFNLKYFEVNSPYHDCRYSETQSTAESIVNAIKYIQTKKPIYAISCISAADTVFDHVFVEDNFREWLVNTGIPQSFLCKNLEF